MIRRLIDLRSLLVRDRAERVVICVTALMVISVAAALAGLTWRVLGGNDGRDRVALAEVVSTGAASGSDITPILAFAPFGGSTANAVAGGSGLILKAIFMAFPAEASSAVIAVGDAPAAAVMPGQSLSSGAVVQSIEVDHVILQVGGALERLDFPNATLTATAATTGAATTATVGAAPTIAPAPTTTPTSASARPAGASTPSVVEQYRQRLAGNPQGVATQLGVTATAGGYRVGDSLSSELRAAGLRPGDVVEKVNNQPVGAIDSDRRLLDEAITSGGARVEVLRNGRRVTLSFPLR